MNSCPEKDKLNLYFLNLLNEEEMKNIEEHLRTCDKCIKELKVEREIKKELSFEIEPGDIQKIIVKKVKIYKFMPKFHPWLKFLKIFLISTTSFSIFFAIWFILLSIQWRDIIIFKSEESKGLVLLLSFYFKELTSTLNPEKLKLFSILFGVGFFLFNFLYALRRYIFGNRTI